MTMSSASTNELIKRLWLGLALSSMFFYPLTASLAEQPYYLHWTGADSARFVFCWIILASILGAALIGVARLRSPWSTFWLLAVIAIPAASAGIHVLRQLGMKDALNKNFTVILAILGMVAIVIMAVLLVPRLRKWCDRLRTGLLVFIMVFSPVSVLSLYTMVMGGINASVAEAGDTEGPLAQGKPKGDVYIILLDELSYEFLYEDGDVKGRFANLKELSQTADNFHNVTAPGDCTRNSLPGYVLARPGLKVDFIGNMAFHEDADGELHRLSEYEDSLFTRAKGNGYQTFLYGWLHQYHEVVSCGVDRMRSFGMYKYASENSLVSLMSPFLSTAQIWPRNYPFLLLKGPIAAMSHSQNVRDITSLTIEAISRELPPTFLFVHIPIPHNPFVFTSSGFNPPRNPFAETVENYLNQLDYADQLVGRFVARMKEEGTWENATVIILSDHNFRMQVPRSEWSRIAMLIKKPGQQSRLDIKKEAKALDLLLNLPALKAD
jgi:hypothetical protein